MDLLAEPARWPLVGVLVRPMSNRAQWSSLDGDPGPAVEAARRALLEQVERLGREGRVEGYCARLPLLVLERHLVERTAERTGSGRRLGEPVAGALQRALAGAPGPTLADAALWSAVPEISDPANRPALDALLRAMDRPVPLRGIHTALGRPVLSGQIALRLAKAWPEHPASARLRLWARSDGSAVRFLAHRLRRVFGRHWRGWKKRL